MNIKDLDQSLLKRLTILYVEDDDSTRAEVAMFLVKVVGTLYTAPNGAEGLKLFKKYKCDMVITDIQMPVMNGLDMVTQIRKDNAKVPIAVTTAFSDADFLIKAIECGVDKYIVKPIDMLEMLAVIQKCTNYTYMEDKIESLNTYSDYILNQNSSFMFIVNDGNADYANNQLMDMFDVKAYEEIQDKSLFFLEEHQLKKKENWIDYVQEHSHKHFTVSFENGEKKYILTYKHFDEIKKSIFSFRETVESSYLEEREKSLEQV